MKLAIALIFTLLFNTIGFAQTVLKYIDHESNNEMRTLFL